MHDLSSLKGPVLVLSPHLDDGVFSAFAALSTPDATLLTAFTEAAVEGSTHWSTFCGFADAPTEFVQRRREDEAVCRALGVRCRHLGARASNLPEMRELLSAAMESWWREGGGLLLIPAGAGGQSPPGPVRKLVCRLLRRPEGSATHGEHVVVRDAALDLVRRRPKARWGFYFENPYVWNDRPKSRHRALEALAEIPLSRVDLRPDIARKLQASEGYESQCVPILGTKSAYRARMLGHPETYLLAMR